jgi:hypothetical protein
LAEGQFPGPDQEGEHETDQEVVEEFERVADNGRSEDFDLVTGQTRPAIENLEHGVSPWRMFVFYGRASRHRIADAEGYPVNGANGKPSRTRVTSAQTPQETSCRPAQSGSWRGRAAGHAPLI